MLTIVCDKCHKTLKSNWGVKKFGYIDSENHYAKEVYLCESCQKSLQWAIDSTITSFLELEPLHRAVNWNPYNTLL